MIVAQATLVEGYHQAVKVQILYKEECGQLQSLFCFAQPLLLEPGIMGAQSNMVERPVVSEDDWGIGEM